MNRKILILASVLGLTAVILGAFGAHGLKEVIGNESLKTFETGIRYQMYHALLLLFLGNSRIISLKAKKWIFYLTGVGVLFFSGSIYGLATNSLSTFNFKIIGFITPIGGLLLIASWFLLLIDFIKNKEKTLLNN